MKLQIVCGADAPTLQRQTHPTALCVMRIEIDDRDHNVALPCSFLWRSLAVSDDLLIIGLQKLHRMIALQRWMRAPRLVHTLDQVAHVTRFGRVPTPNLILLRIEIFFAAAFAGLVLAKLKCRSINAVACA